MKKRQFLLLPPFLSVINFITLLNTLNPTLGSNIVEINKPRFGIESKFDFENATSVVNTHHRSKRFIHLNIFGTFDVGFLVVTPVIFVLPAWSNIFNVFRKRKRRSITSQPHRMMNLRVDSGNENPSTQQQVDKVVSYFNLLEIPEPECQIRAICELAADPDAYLPLSDIVLKRIRKITTSSYAYSKEMNENCTTLEQPDGKSLNDYFIEAADTGESLGMQKCEESYSSWCKYDTEKLLNMPVLNYWRTLTSQLKLKFSDELASHMM